MSIFVDNYPSVNLRCDGCGVIVCVAENQTDRLLVHDYIHQNGWMTTKAKGKWINLCPECKGDYLARLRAKMLDKYI